MKSQIYLILSLLLISGCGEKQSENPQDIAPPPAGGIPPEMIKTAGLDVTRGLKLKTENTTAGYVLFSSLTSSELYMIDMDGNVVNSWSGELALGSHYLMDDGRVFVHARDPQAPVFSGGGMAGRIMEYSWDGDLLCEYKRADESHLMHHDFSVMPNGNILGLVWEAKSPEEAIRAGREPHLVPQAGVWPDVIMEIKPIRPSGGEIVWEWHTWDHIIQDKNPDLPNYGSIASNPGKININAGDSIRIPEEDEFEQARARGQLAANATRFNRGSDLYHSNAIDYNPQLDQIAVSSPEFSEIWIIDHSTTTEEAAGSSGGKSGKGGDILYRWGNPQMYGRGDSTTQYLGYQHDVRWILPGYPGEGHLTIFNNNHRDPDGTVYSQVIEINPEMDASGNYIIPENGPIPPSEPVWQYSANNEEDVHAMFISSAHRMKNGNTLVNFGPQGKFQEITPDGNVVWEYWSPYIGEIRLPDGNTPQPVGPFKYAVFRATHIAADHPALRDKKLIPYDPQPPVQKPF